MVLEDCSFVPSALLCLIPQLWMDLVVLESSSFVPFFHVLTKLSTLGGCGGLKSCSFVPFDPLCLVLVGIMAHKP